MITSRKHSRKVSAADSAELEAIVFDLVRNRLLDAVGAGGMWTLQFRSESDTDVIFGETIAEIIARDVAGNIAADHAAADHTAIIEATPSEAPTAEAEPGESPVRDVKKDLASDGVFDRIFTPGLPGFDEACTEIDLRPAQLVA